MPTVVWDQQSLKVILSLGEKAEIPVSFMSNMDSSKFSVKASSELSSVVTLTPSYFDAIEEESPYEIQIEITSPSIGEEIASPYTGTISIAKNGVDIDSSLILNLIVGDVLQVEEFNFSFAVPPDFDALKSINLPSSVLGGFNLISPEMPTIVIKVHKNETGLSVSDWYYENMSDNEFWVHGFKVQDSDTRIEREIIVSGRTALHIESEMMGVRQIRTWVPNDTTILEVSTSLSDVADVSGAYWQVLDSLDLL